MTRPHTFDIGKDVFHIVGFDAALRKKFNRLALESEFAKLAPSLEANNANENIGSIEESF
jgi:hypothetical protein